MLEKHNLMEKRGVGLNVASQSHSRESYLVNEFSDLSFQQHESISKQWKSLLTRSIKVMSTTLITIRAPRKVFREAIQRSQ